MSEDYKEQIKEATKEEVIESEPLHSPDLLMEEFRRELNALAEFMYQNRNELGGATVRKLIPFAMGYPFIVPNEDKLSEIQMAVLGSCNKLMDIRFNLIMHAATLAAQREKKDE